MIVIVLPDPDCPRCGGLGGLGQAGEKCLGDQLPAMACHCTFGEEQNDDE